MSKATTPLRAAARAAVGITAVLFFTCGRPVTASGQPDPPGLELGTNQQALDLDGKWSPVVTPIGPDALPDLPYWPFTDTIPEEDGQWDEVRPVLVATVIDQRIDEAGCGELTWTEHPIPGTYVPGPFCVALYSNADGVPLIVVGRPGHNPYLFLPARDVTAFTRLPDGTVQVDERRLGMGALPAVAHELCGRWAKTPLARIEP